MIFERAFCNNNRLLLLLLVVLFDVVIDLYIKFIVDMHVTTVLCDLVSHSMSLFYFY